MVLKSELRAAVRARNQIILDLTVALKRLVEACPCKVCDLVDPHCPTRQGERLTRMVRSLDLKLEGGNDIAQEQMDAPEPQDEEEKHPVIRCEHSSQSPLVKDSTG